MLVFVYGTLKRGFGNHRVLGDSTFVGNATTEGKYPMVCTNGYFPYLINRPGVGHNISGEVYDVNDDVLEGLRMLEGVPIHYYESNVVVHLENGEFVYATAFFWTAANHLHESEIFKFDFLKSFEKGEHRRVSVLDFLDAELV